MLANFGFIQDKLDFETVCGTVIYAAPEISQSHTYTASVDLLSIGVIILEYTYGLPEAPSQKRG